MSETFESLQKGEDSPVLGPDVHDLPPKTGADLHRPDAAGSVETGDLMHDSVDPTGEREGEGGMLGEG